MRGAIAGEPFLISQCLQHRLAQHDADIFDSVVVVDMGVARRLDDEVEEPVSRQELEHMVEEPDASADIGTSGPVEDDLDLNLGFRCGAADFCAAHYARVPSMLLRGLLAVTTRYDQAEGPLT